MRPARSLAARITALGVAGAFAAAAAPLPATAAPASCAGTGGFAAQSGAELIRLTKLEVRPGGGRATDSSADSDISGGRQPGTAQPRKPTGPDSTGADQSADPAAVDQDGGDMPAPAATDRAEGGTTVIRDLLVGEAKTALVGTASPSAAAVTRMVNSSEKSRLSRPLVQQAPPDNTRPARRATPAAEVGPLLIDAGALTSHAKSACATDGEATRAAATLGAAAVADHRDDALVVVPEKVESLSTTALEQRAAGARSKSTASIAVRTFELLDGAVRVRVTRPPTLATSMSAREGGAVRYVPAVLEVSGEGIKRTTLSAPGDSMEMTFSDRTEAGAGSATTLKDLPIGPPLTLPEVPGVPSLDRGGPESTSADEPGTTVTISLGKIRQAAQGSAIAARASAVEIGITKRAYPERKPVVALDLTIGELESAAVAADSAGGVAGAVAGRGGGLPVTGPGVALIALGGAALLLAGAAAVAFGMRRDRRFRA